MADLPLHKHKLVIGLVWERLHLELTASDCHERGRQPFLFHALVAAIGKLDQVINDLG